jgi:phosphate starvation-inducible PhoH-like protein
MNTDRTIELNSMDILMDVLGKFDENIKLLESMFNVTIFCRDNTIVRVSGEEGDVGKVIGIIDQLSGISARGDEITRQQVIYIANMSLENRLDELSHYADSCICVSVRGKQIKAKTRGQEQYVKAVSKNTVTFCIGPAGTGKTYLAVAMAVNAFKNKIVDRIILTRPAVEAGEKLGFLPGDLQNKVDPYLRPLYDALFDTIGAESYHRYVEKGMIEVAPLAYMRGRTLDDSFIILDEAQNTTFEQMKMFVTRIGFGSKVVVTGDITQVDLPYDKKSGLREVIKILKDIDDIQFIYLTEKDVVRHELVQKIIRAYDNYENGKRK